MNMKRHLKCTILIIPLLVLVCGLNNSEADSFPTKALTMIVPFGAGSNADINNRQLADIAEKYVGKPITVVNKPGGSSAVGIGYALSQPADGYMLCSFSPSFGLLVIQKKAAFKLGDIEPLLRYNGQPSSLMVLSSKYSTLEDFVKAAKENPGKLKVGGPGAGTFHNLVAEQFKKEAGIDFTWVPYGGGKEPVLNLLGGFLDGVITTPGNAKSQIDSGQIKVLAVSSEQRSEYFPETPTFSEKGYPMDLTLWRGLFVKKGTPPERMKILEQAFKNAVEDPRWIAFNKKHGENNYYLNSAAFAKSLEQEIKTFEGLSQVFTKPKSK